MTGRRGFLGLLLGSPLIAQEAAEELANVKTTGVGLKDAFEPAECSDGDGATHPWDSMPGGQKLMKALDDEIRKRDDRAFRGIPPHIDEMKSWSRAFKSSVAEKERQKTASLWEEFYNLERADPLTAAIKARSLAKKLRVKA